MITRETQEGLTCIKWKDKRDVHLLLTIHTNEIVEVTTKRKKVVQNPKDVVMYNAEHFQSTLGTYNNKALRRCTKRYR